MFESLGRLFKDAFGDLEATARRFAGKNSMNRIAAVGAMVAYLPDGDADDDERKSAVKAMYALTNGIYTVEDMRAAVDKHVETLSFMPEIGKAQLFKEILPASGTDEAPLLVAVAIAVGKASGPKDDPFTPDERKLAAEIARHLGLDPVKYDILKK